MMMMIIIMWGNVLSASPASPGPWHFTCHSVTSAPCFFLSRSLMRVVALSTLPGHCLGHPRPPGLGEMHVLGFPASFLLPQTPLYGNPGGSLFEAFRAQHPPWVWLYAEM